MGKRSTGAGFSAPVSFCGKRSWGWCDVPPVLLEPIAQALLFFALCVAASSTVVLLARSAFSPLGVAIRSSAVFVGGLLLWLWWSSLDLPAWGGLRIGYTTWPLGVLAVLTGLNALAVELLGRRLQLVERLVARPSEPAPSVVREKLATARDVTGG